MLNDDSGHGWGENLSERSIWKHQEVVLHNGPEGKGKTQTLRELQIASNENMGAVFAVCVSEPPR